MIDAGADVIFIEAPETLDQLKTIPQLFDVPVMINMFPGGKTPYTPPADLQSWGYRYMIVPSDIQRACIQATEQILQAIKADGSSLKVADLLCPLADRDRIVDQDRWLEKPE